MARRMKINSVVGSYLDPLADKVNPLFFIRLTGTSLIPICTCLWVTDICITYLVDV